MSGFSRGMLHHLGDLFVNGTFEESDRDYSQIHISEITGCAKRLWLQLKVGPPNIKPVSMPMKIGTSLHELTESIITNNHPNTSSEVLVDFNPEFPVIGSADLVDDNYVIDLKFLSSWKYKTFSTDLGYKMQVLTYAYGLQRKFASLFLVDRGTLNFKAKTYLVKDYINEITFFLNRAKDIFNSEEQPDKEHETPNNMECKWCPFKKKCWGDHE